MSSSERKILGTLFIILVLDLTAFTCILPLFPSLMDFYAARSNRDWLYNACEGALKSFRAAIGAPDIPRFNSVFFGGLLGSLFSALQFLSSPMMGAMSDVYGRKPVLVVATLGSLTSYILWSGASTFTIFLLSRIVGGLSKTSVSVATALIADICPPNRRGKGMALIGIAFSVAFLIGPMIGAYFASQARNNAVISFSTPAMFSITLTLIELILLLFLMPESLPFSKKIKQPHSAKGIIDNWKLYVCPKSLANFVPVSDYLNSESLGKVCTYGRVYYLYLFLYSGLEFTLTFFTHIRFSYDSFSMQQGRMYLFAGMLMILIQGGYVRRIAPGQHLKAAQWGLAFIIPAYVVIGMSQTIPIFYMGLGLYAFASALVVPCLTTCVSNLVADEDGQKGALMGVFRSLGALARALGPFVASAGPLSTEIYVSWWSVDASATVKLSVFWCLGPTTCYIIGGLLLTVPYVLLRNQTKDNQKST